MADLARARARRLPAQLLRRRRVRRPERPRRLSGSRATITAAVGGAAVLALVAACAAFAWPDDSPLVPRNAGHPGGDTTWAWLFLVAAGTALAVYGAMLLVVSRARLALVTALAVAIQLAPLGAPLLLSTDAWTYWLYGRIAAERGGNPYTDEPDQFRDDPAFRWIGEDWRDSTSVYGPAFTLASEPLALAAGESEDAAAWIAKAVAAAFALAAVLLAARLSSRPAFAVAFVGWNPLLAIHLAGGGHNDAWLGALALAALALSGAGRRRLAGAAWALAILVKWIPALFLALWALHARATRRAVGWGGLVIAGAIVLGLATVRYGFSWLGAFGPLARNANQETSYALPHRLEQLGLPEWLALGVAGVALALALVVLARRAVAGRLRLGLAAVALLLATPYLAPWYLAWAVPLAAAEDDRTAQVICLGLCAYLLPQTVPV